MVRGSVVNASIFEKGGSLALGAFKPGAGAAADDETDQISSIIIRGIKDTLPGENTPFTVSGEDQNSTDTFLEGFIENYGRDELAARQKLRKNQVFLSIDGEIWSHQTGEKIFSFQTSCVINLKTQNPKTVAYQMGVAIAQFIGSHKESNP